MKLGGFVGTTNDNWKKISLDGYASFMIFNEDSTNSISVSIGGTKENFYIRANVGLDLQRTFPTEIYIKNRSVGNDCAFQVIPYGNVKQPSTPGRENVQIPVAFVE